MQVSTGGIQIGARGRFARDVVELISSMRFAISLLSIIAIASIIGTVVKQNEPIVNYVNQFGPFWFGIFRALALNAVYNSAWFLIILAFLVLSTTLCIVRNAPKMLRDMRAWRDHVREDSLRNFGHKYEAGVAAPPAAVAATVATLLTQRGFKLRQGPRDNDSAILVTAKAGTWNRLGYIFAHGAIVMICLGGLLDSELLVRAQVWFGGKQPVRGDVLVKDVPASGRMTASNPSFRGNVLVPEGAAVRHAILNYRNDALIQELPFTLALKKFIVEYYSTGMPKLFASEVELTDHDTGKTTAHTIKVNEPLIHRGIAIYQSSFEDGGSKLVLKGWPMRGPGTTPFPVQGEVGSSVKLSNDGKPGANDLTIEFSGFRAINVENTVSPEAAAAAADATEKKFRDSVAAVLSSASSATHGNKTRDLKNVGPSVQYKLRDATGQAREFSNYMLPVELEGRKVFLAGIRNNPNEEFRFLRLPADAEGTLTEFMRLRAALANPKLRAEAAQRYAMRALPASAPAQAELRERLRDSALRGLETFAGADGGNGGFFALAAWLRQTVTPAEQENASNVVMKILTGTLWDLWQLARAAEGLKPLQPDDANTTFAHQATNALSDTFLYGAPFLLQLESFEHVQASVFQMTRSPGQNIVYLGCLLLVLGIFAMFYICERRAWFWLKDDGAGATHLLMAMSTTRPNLDFNKEFEAMTTACAQLSARATPPSAPSLSPRGS